MKITKWQIWKAKRTLKKFLKNIKKKNKKFIKFLSLTNQLLYNRFKENYQILIRDIDFDDIKFSDIDDRFFWFKVKINKKELYLPVIRERVPFDISGTGKYGVVIWKIFNEFFEYKPKS